MSPIKLFVQIAKLVASRNHMAGFDLSHQLFRAAYDIAFYSGFTQASTFHFLTYSCIICSTRGSWKWKLPSIGSTTLASVPGRQPIDSSLKKQRLVSCAICLLTGARSRKGGCFPPLLWRHDDWSLGGKLFQVNFLLEAISGNILQPHLEQDAGCRHLFSLHWSWLG